MNRTYTVKHFEYNADGMSLVLKNAILTFYDGMLHVDNNQSGMSAKIHLSKFCYKKYDDKKDYLKKFIFYDQKTLGIWSDDDTMYIKIVYEKDDLFNILRSITSYIFISNHLMKIREIYAEGENKKNPMLHYYTFHNEAIDKVLKTESFAMTSEL